VVRWRERAGWRKRVRRLSSGEEEGEEGMSRALLLLVVEEKKSCGPRPRTVMRRRLRAEQVRQRLPPRRVV
jgi:hypothetical protein